MKKSEVTSRVKRLVDWESEPSLDDNDVNYLVSMARVRDAHGNDIEDVIEWEPLTRYYVGDVVVNANQEKFLCLTEGVSGYEPLTPSSTTDGTTEWVYQGESSWTPTYDVNRACYEGWGLKAAKAASMIGFTSDGATFQRQQYIENCERMQRRFAQAQSVVIRKRYNKTFIGVPYDCYD
jgi:hypothetical protein